MHAEIFLAIMVLAVALLVAADFFRRSSEGPHEHDGRPASDAGRETAAPPRGASAGAGTSGAGTSVWAAGGAGATPTVTAFEPARGAATGGWLVRTRLTLLAAASALAAAAATASVIRAADVLGSASYHSDVSSIRDGAAASAILAAVAAVAALAIGGWAAALLIRSVLRPLNQLRTGAVELAEVRLPDALRSGGRGPLAVRSVGLSSSDEIGQIARAFDQVQAEVLGVTSDDAGLRGKLGEMFVELSSRSQALVDRQIRLIDELEQGERDAERLASLFKMDHIATRMRRYSQNLLVLAGHELPGEWNRPVALVDVIRAALSQIEDYERVSLSAQPGISVAGPAVKDVVHLLAELAENATSLSAAGTEVDISGRSLASGGILVDITDQGVGMNPEVMTEANRRLDSPPAMDFAVSRNMGLFVVGRLAARHGIKVRLQQATAGGLTAMVWLPDAVASRPDGTPGFDSPDPFPGRGAHASPRPSLPPSPAPAPAPPALDRTPADRQAVWSAPVLEDVRPPATSPYPSHSPSLTASTPTAPARHAWPDTGLQPAPSSPVRTQPSSLPQRLVASPRPAPAQPAPAEPPAADTSSGPEATFAADAVAADAGERRLPIYDAVESDWFGNHRRQAGGSTAATVGGWTAPADPGWGAAQAVVRPASSGTTAAGLPVRSPRANLVPGTIGASATGASPTGSSPAGSGPAPGQPPIPRSASAVRDRLSGFQRGTSQGRAALGQDDEG